MTEPESGGVLPITLTEVIVLLFFVLALAFAWNTRELESVPEPVRESFVDGAGLEPEAGWTAVVRCIEEVEKCDPGAADVLIDIAGNLGIETAGLTPSEVADSIKRQIEAARAAADSAAMEQGLDPAPIRGPGPLVSIVSPFRGQGDYPPCWADYDETEQRIIHAFQVTLFSDMVRLRPSWTSDYEDDARSVTGLLRLAEAGQLEYGEFRRLAQPVLEWSDRQDPPCRHYVAIHDSVSGGDEKETFKANLLTVEGYFYKHLVN